MSNGERWLLDRIRERESGVLAPFKVGDKVVHDSCEEALVTHVNSDGSYNIEFIDFEDGMDGVPRSEIDPAPEEL